MAAREEQQNNILRQTIRKQLDKPSSSVSNEKRPFAPIENKPSNRLSSLFANFFGKKQQKGLVVVGEKMPIEDKLNQEHTAFEHFNPESLSLLVVPQNKNQEKYQESAVINSKEQFNGKIEDKGEALPIAEGTAVFDGEILENQQELPIAKEVSTFNGEILDQEQELLISREVSVFDGEILENHQELPIAKEVSVFDEEIVDKEQELQVAEVIPEFEGEIQDKGKEEQLVESLDQFNGEIVDDLDQELQKEITAEKDVTLDSSKADKIKIDTKESLEIKKAEAALESAEAKVLVEVSADEDGVSDLNLFVTAQIPEKARKRGLTPAKLLANKINKAKKGVHRHTKGEQKIGGGINLTR